MKKIDSLDPITRDLLIADSLTAQLGVLHLVTKLNDELSICAREMVNPWWRRSELPNLFRLNDEIEEESAALWRQLQGLHNILAEAWGLNDEPGGTGGDEA